MGYRHHWLHGVQTSLCLKLLVLIATYRRVSSTPIKPFLVFLKQNCMVESSFECMMDSEKENKKKKEKEINLFCSPTDFKLFGKKYFG